MLRVLRIKPTAAETRAVIWFPDEIEDGFEPDETTFRFERILHNHGFAFSERIEKRWILFWVKRVKRISPF